jgi:transposase
MMTRAKNGQAVRPIRRTLKAQRNLAKRQARALKEGDLATWRRVKAVLGYIRGRATQHLADEAEVDRSTISRWLQHYDRDSLAGLESGAAPGAVPRLNLDQHNELGAIIDAGPQAAGFDTGVWTGPMIGQVIKERWKVQYHHHHIPKLLHQIGFSVQRPRKRLARADKEAQAYWIRERFPEVKKKPPSAGELSCSVTKSASG